MYGDDIDTVVADLLSSELIATAAFKAVVAKHGTRPTLKAFTYGTILQGMYNQSADTVIAACESAIGDKFERWWAGFKTHLEDWRLGTITSIAGIIDVILELETVRRIHKISTATDNAVDKLMIAASNISHGGVKQTVTVGGKDIHITLPPKASPELLKAEADKIRVAGSNIIKKIGIKYWLIFFGIIAVANLSGKSIRNTPRALENILSLKLPTSEDGFKQYSWKIHDILERDTAFSLGGTYFDKEVGTARMVTHPVSVSVSAAQVTDVLKSHADALERFKKIPDRLLAIGYTPEANTAWGTKGLSLLSAVVRIVIDHSISTGNSYKSFLQRLDKMNDTDSDNTY